MILKFIGNLLQIEFDSPPTRGENALLSEVRAKKTPSPQAFLAPGAVTIYRMIHRRFPKIVDDPSIDLLVSPRPNDIDWTSHQPSMYPFQMEAASRLIQQPRGILCALSPGLGKSLVSISAADILNVPQILVVAPLTLLGTWRAEIEKWSRDPSLQIVRGTVDKFSSRWVITNYEMFCRKSIFHRPWPLIIFDESILLKSRVVKHPVEGHAKTRLVHGSQRADRAYEIGLLASRVWLLSGSPTSRDISDLFQQFKIIRPEIFTSFWRFAEEYCIIDRSSWGTEIRGTKPGIDPTIEFSDVFFSVSRDQAVSLPPETHERIEVDLLPDQARMVDKLIDDFLLEATDRDIPVSTKLAQLIRLGEIGSGTSNVRDDLDVSGKTETLVEMIDLGMIPFPTIVWTHWRKSAQSLVSRLLLEFPSLKVQYLSSDLSSEGRTLLVSQFQGGEIDILVASLGVGKYGLTLTSAYSYIYYDRSYDADAIVQSSFRVSRIGLDHPVLVYTLATPIDSWIDLNLDGKLRDIGQITNTDWSGLLQSLRRC